MLIARRPLKRNRLTRRPPSNEYSRPHGPTRAGLRGKSDRSGKRLTLKNPEKKGAFWIWAPESRGIWGPIVGSRDQAYHEGRMYVKEKFEVVFLNTIDKAKATAILKARRMHNEGIPLRQAVRQRFKHKFGKR